MRRAWVLGCAAGEAGGIALVGAAYGAVSRGLLSDPAIVAAGAWEGLCLGTAQALILRRLGVAALPWIAATVAAATLGYAGSLAFTPGGPDTGPPPPDPPVWLLVGGAAGIGAGLGVLMGLAQGLTARGVLSLGRWVLANAMGWMPAMVAIFLPATWIAPTATLAEVALVGVLSGAMAGLCLGLVTATALPPPKD
jgi:hypothetical protein